jgi:enoyl-CoA hydratase/carnithine racemase
MTEPRVLVTVENTICHIQLNRADKLNAADRQLLAEFSSAFNAADGNPDVRVVVVSAVGPHFTAGLDIGDVLGSAQGEGLNLIPKGNIDPWAMATPRISKPVIVAANGTCFTLGVELILATDIAICDDTSIFGQLEVTRGIIPFGGATTRFPARCGWGNAMKYMLTGDTFGAEEALRIGLVQEIVPAGKQVERALELAVQIAAQAPLAISALVANATLGTSKQDQAHQQLPGELARLLHTEDFAAGVAAFSTRTQPTFQGK